MYVCLCVCGSVYDCMGVRMHVLCARVLIVFMHACVDVCACMTVRLYA